MAPDWIALGMLVQLTTKAAANPSKDGGKFPKTPIVIDGKVVLLAVRHSLLPGSASRDAAPAPARPDVKAPPRLQHQPPPPPQFVLPITAPPIDSLSHEPANLEPHGRDSNSPHTYRIHGSAIKPRKTELPEHSTTITGHCRDRRSA